MTGPHILKDEIQAAIRKMKSGQARGPDSISVQFYKHLKTMELIRRQNNSKKCYDTGQIPINVFKSIFIAQPKKPKGVECELHRTVNLTNHITRILLRIIIMRDRRKIKTEIPQKLCGFEEGKDAKKFVYIFRTIIARALEVQKRYI